MPVVISFVSTKGGVGKTTVAANLGGLLAAFGMKVLEIDADVQPSLSKFFPVHYRSPRGLSAVVTSGGNPSADCISRTIFSNLDLIYSDTPDAELQSWLNRREDRLMIMRRAMNSPLLEGYDVVLIDTQGAVGELQKSAAMAADFMVSPVKPDALSAAEFATGTITMLDDLNRLADFGETFRSGDLLALINAHERTVNARALATVLRQRFSDHRRVRVLDTVVPSAAAYAAAATARVPVHDFDRRRRFGNSAWNVMHRLAWELFPSLANVYAGSPGPMADGVELAGTTRGAVA
ncbi:MAG: ParA-like protein [uncultured Paraburkholderia sp.]|uniref:ParA family protein n=1 Tax=uncultured Paraburkholderia sp. TaxID=1822466 RepID=UPI002595A4C9|nr:ParA family protein [uncultured Paraburkholderia sp.]CAH2902174.1 MAG: ParA-like protein [uncultured Paraburkholderia sp.]CAH2936397.1 MAG: ParA-like protein [uncultured Paraburkholderia sp.]